MRRELGVPHAELGDRASHARVPEFISFIVSTIPITVSALTRLPTSTNGAAPGRGAR